MDLLTELAILVLAAFVGFEVISKVPNTLHTPLMSGTNAIHGIVVLGGLILIGPADGFLESVLLVIPGGEPLALTGEVSGDYVGVSYNGAQGWVDATFLTTLSG